MNDKDKTKKIDGVIIHDASPNPCYHQFFEVRKIANPSPSLADTATISIPTDWGVLVVCAHCGEKRELWAEDKLKIL